MSLRPVPVCAPAAKPARRYGPAVPVVVPFCRFRKTPRFAARMFSWELPPVRLDGVGDRPFVGTHRANGADVSRNDEISYLSLKLTQLIIERSASNDAQPAARELSKLQTRDDAIGNSVPLCRK